ncbi:hypothetical protein [Chitinimonas sp. BJYL2]|uniref:hypothetical protein n=1 Tax=Chitinimonas sp. BJYL2 TaxID=2976696 RepID=UPI0022B3581A|nr:hypothetical protein [Chitinimonas sp. BJYL2]
MITLADPTPWQTAPIARQSIWLACLTVLTILTAPVHALQGEPPVVSTPIDSTAPVTETETPPLRAELQGVEYVRAFVAPVQLGEHWRLVYQLAHTPSAGDMLILAKGAQHVAVYARQIAQLPGKAARYALTESQDLPTLPAHARLARCSLPGESTRSAIVLSGRVAGPTQRVWGVRIDDRARLAALSATELASVHCLKQGVTVQIK